MKQLLLAVFLVSIPVAVFVSARHYLIGNTAVSTGLGDLSSMKAIVSDVQSIAAKGDLASAKVRIADLETAWDDAEPTLRPIDPEAWGVVDGAADAALNALRAAQPDPVAVQTTLSALIVALANPTSGDGAAGTLTMVEGIAVTDANGHPLPCEELLTTAKDGLSSLTTDAANRADVSDLIAKATERCNADDDRHADDFSARALHMVAAK